MPHLGKAIALFALMASAAPLPVLAADDGLYDAPVDPNSAFVRVLAPGATVAVVNGNTLNNLTGGLSPYVNVKPGEISVSAGEETGKVTASPGGYYTYARSADGKSLVLEDKASSDPSKASVYFYNLSDKAAVDLFVPSAKVNALQAVPADGTKAVALKAPLKIDLELRDGTTTLATVPAVDLKRRGGVTIVLTGTAGGYSAAATENSFSRTQ
jgi:alginate O-acetyltransferase complex protein AlgF